MTRRAEAIANIAERVLRALSLRDAYGRDKAIPQKDVADAAGTNTRTLQEATALMIERGVAVVTTCGKPCGMFIAVTDEELKDYDRQLMSRIKWIARRVKGTRRIIRKRIEGREIEPGGQRRLAL